MHTVIYLDSFRDLSKVKIELEYWQGDGLLCAYYTANIGNIFTINTEKLEYSNSKLYGRFEYVYEL